MTYSCDVMSLIAKIETLRACYDDHSLLVRLHTEFTHSFVNGGRVKSVNHGDDLAYARQVASLFNPQRKHRFNASKSVISSLVDYLYACKENDAKAKQKAAFEITAVAPRNSSIQAVPAAFSQWDEIKVMDFALSCLEGSVAKIHDTRPSQVEKKSAVSVTAASAKELETLRQDCEAALALAHEQEQKAAGLQMQVVALQAELESIRSQLSPTPERVEMDVTHETFSCTQLRDFAIKQLDAADAALMTSLFDYVSKHHSSLSLEGLMQYWGMTVEYKVYPVVLRMVKHLFHLSLTHHLCNAKAVSEHCPILVIRDGMISTNASGEYRGIPKARRTLLLLQSVKWLIETCGLLLEDTMFQQDNIPRVEDLGDCYHVVIPKINTEQLTRLTEENQQLRQRIADLEEALNRANAVRVQLLETLQQAD